MPMSMVYCHTHVHVHVHALALAVCFATLAMPMSMVYCYTHVHVHALALAVCFAILGLAVGGVKLQDPSCVRKTVPSFFQILAAPPPGGLGVEIWECNPESGVRVRRLVEPADLFAAK